MGLHATTQKGSADWRFVRNNRVVGWCGRRTIICITSLTGRQSRAICSFTRNKNGDRTPRSRGVAAKSAAGGAAASKTVPKAVFWGSLFRTHVILTACGREVPSRSDDTTSGESGEKLDEFQNWRNCTTVVRILGSPAPPPGGTPGDPRGRGPRQAPPAPILYPNSRSTALCGRDVSYFILLVNKYKSKYI